MRFGAMAVERIGQLLGVALRVDDGQLDPGGSEVIGEEMSETAVAAENPVSAWRPVGLGERGFRQRGQQFDEAEAFRRGDGERQVFGKARDTG